MGDKNTCKYCKHRVFHYKLYQALTTSGSPGNGDMVLPSGFGAFGSGAGASNKYKTVFIIIAKFSNYSLLSFITHYCH